MRNTGIFIIIVGIGIIILTCFTSFTTANIDIGKIAIIKNKVQNFNWIALTGPVVLWIGAVILARSPQPKLKVISR